MEGVTFFLLQLPGPPAPYEANHTRWQNTDPLWVVSVPAQGERHYPTEVIQTQSIASREPESSDSDDEDDDVDNIRDFSGV